MGVDANTLLRLTDLTVDFESQEGVVHAVDKVSFSVASGELVGLVGESGCGKSVTASAILGLTRMVNNATISGTIEFLGRDLVALPESEVRDIRGKDISMIFQDPVTSLYPVLSIERLMTEGLEVHLGLSHADAVKRSIELLQLVGIPQAAGRIKDYPHPYTGGLLRSVPRLNEPRKDSLQTIAGLPPDLAHLPPGCSFAPRCWLATEECWRQVPELSPTEAGRLSACFHRDKLIAGAEMPA